MQSQPAILIFAQSARFIAEVATHAGYPVWVADCFGDEDTLAIAARFHALAPLAELTTAQVLEALLTLSQHQPCLLVCGTGIERFYPLLSQLPPQIQVVGNSATTLQQLRDHTLFFPLLDALSLPYPALQQHASDQSLKKNLYSAGGTGINTAHTATGDFYQQYIAGQAASVCFIANGQQAVILGINAQYNDVVSYRLNCIQSPLPISEQQHDLLQHAINVLTQNTRLLGLNSLDFIIAEDGQIYLLEVNPRFSASLELLPNQQQLFDWHMQACAGILPPPPPSQRQYAQLHYLFSDTRVTINHHAVWPDSCHDRPVAGSTIPAGAPICTIISRADHPALCQQHYETCVKQLKNTLIISA